MSAVQVSRNATWIRRMVEEYEGPLLRYAAHLLGDDERARDVVQDTFLRLCTQPRDQVDGHVAQWLYTVCRHRALDILRKESRMSSASPEHVTDQPSREPQQAEATEMRDSVQQILALLGRLPRNQQEVVRLKFQNGLSYREISQVTELSIGNVGYLLHTALERLRRDVGITKS